MAALTHSFVPYIMLSSLDTRQTVGQWRILNIPQAPGSQGG